MHILLGTGIVQWRIGSLATRRTATRMAQSGSGTYWFFSSIWLDFQLILLPAHSGRSLCADQWVCHLLSTTISNWILHHYIFHSGDLFQFRFICGHLFRNVAIRDYANLLREKSFQAVPVVHGWLPRIGRIHLHGTKIASIDLEKVLKSWVY